mmetsp:Transcript_10690/g.33966  ORF Transcript_10690/g.33966 Transcript_10690/m.33966 type:complete len:205 (+) Transcript_10690:489-1103(+)
MYDAGLTAVAALHFARAVGPSMRMAQGRAHKKDMTVRTPKRFSGVMFFPFGRSIDARERMLRVAKARLESIAPEKESHVKESSLTEASATPATIGTRARAAGAEIVAPRMPHERRAVQTGSAALTICVKETAPAPADTTAPMWPSACRKEIGSSVATAARGSDGRLRRPVAQRKETKAEPTASEAAEWHHGSAIALSRTLFAML